MSTLNLWREQISILLQLCWLIANSHFLRRLLLLLRLHTFIIQRFLHVLMFWVFSYIFFYQILLWIISDGLTLIISKIMCHSYYLSLDILASSVRLNSMFEEIKIKSISFEIFFRYQSTFDTQFNSIQFFSLQKI